MKFKYLKRVAWVATFFLLLNAVASGEVSGLIAGSLRGTGEVIEAIVEPAIGFEYSTRRMQFDSSWSTTFTDQARNIWTGQWQSSNSIKWSAPAQKLSAVSDYIHGESTDIAGDRLRTSDLLNTAINLVMPVTPSLRQNVSLSLEYQRLYNELTNNEAADKSGLASYSVQWRNTKRQMVNLGGSYNLYDSGSTISSGYFGWAMKGQRVEIDTKVNYNVLWLDRNQTSFIGGSGSINYHSPRYLIGLNLKREQTNALSFFDLGFVDAPVEQQQQIAVDEFSLSISDFKLTQNTLMSMSFLVGNSATLYEVPELDLSDELDIDYEALMVSAAHSFSSNSNLILGYKMRQENKAILKSVESVFSSRISANMTYSISLAKKMAENSSLIWSMNLSYGF